MPKKDKKRKVKKKAIHVRRTVSIFDGIGLVRPHGVRHHVHGEPEGRLGDGAVRGALRDVGLRLRGPARSGLGG